MSNLISPKILKGFRDFLPSQQTIRNYCIQQLQETFARFCYVPIDTPILEYKEILLGKSGDETDKQVYHFSDRGKRDVAMRFDLTVPFARYVAMHQNELAFPFARYHIGKVFRGENTQRGRYREFLQCDFDIIGADTVSTDLTIIETIISTLHSLHVYNIKVHISHRDIIRSLLQQENNETVSEVLRIIDKTKKIGKDAVFSQLKTLVSEELCKALLTCIHIDEKNKRKHSLRDYNNSVLSTIRSVLGEDTHTYKRLHSIIESVRVLGLEEYVILDTSITRGLDYYTGFVCETFVDSFEDVGSICSGGRYNDLAGIYSNKKMPGVGASIGLDRLLSIFEDTITVPKHTILAIFPMEQECTAYCHSIMRTLHQHSYHALVYSPSRDDAKRNLNDFFKFTDSIKPDFTIVIGNEELAQNNITIKHLKTKEQLRNVDITAGLTFIHEQSSIS